MRVTDTLKAAGFALAVMIVNVAMSFVVVGVYSVAVAPGHDDQHYQDAAQWIAPWSSVFFGAPLFFLVSFISARRVPDSTRKALPFAACIVVFYAVVDVFVLLAAGATAQAVGMVALSLSTKLVAALLGAHFGRNRS